MKTTFKYIFAIVSLFAFSSAAFAQSGENEEPEQKYEGVHAEKSATYDFTTQKGEITLESFVEGFIKPAESKPLDIVFVWENTGTMNSSISVSGASNAWEALENVIGKFVDNVQAKAPDARVSLVTFSQSCTVRSHLTTDVDAFFSSYPSKTESNNSAYASSIDTAIGEFNYNPRKDASGNPIPTQNVIVYLVGGAVNGNPGIIEKAAPFKKDGGLFVSILIDGNGVKNGDSEHMEYASSNYPDAESYSSHKDKRTENAIYYMRTKELDAFDAFFTALAESITSIPDMGPTVMTKDVLSPSFKLPEGTSLSDITAYAVPCTGVVFDGATGDPKDYTFETDKTKWQPLTIATFVEGQTYPEEKDITKVKVYANITTSEEGNDQLELTGFDYKTFFCGPVYSDSGSKTDSKGKKYDVVGYKFVITLPIVLASGNAASLTTNTSESGLYAANGEQIVFFPLPEVFFAYITIVKEGLKTGESALFKVSKTSGGATTEICQVALTGDGNTSVSKGVYAGMFVPGDTYTVEELTNWGWTYELTGMTLQVGSATAEQMKPFVMIADDPATEEVEGNEGKEAVFTFTNTKKSSIPVKNAENAKLNHLKQGVAR